MTKRKKDFDANPVYCPNCGHFLGYEKIVAGFVAFYCRYCKKYVQFEIEPEDEEKQKKS